MGGSAGANIISLDELEKIKTYKAIHDKASKTQGAAYLGLANKAIKELQKRLQEEASSRLKAKLGTLRLILQSDIDGNDKFTEFKRYLNKNFRIDLSSIIQFSDMIIDKYYTHSNENKEYRDSNPEGNKQYIRDQKKLFVNLFIENFVKSFEKSWQERVDENAINGMITDLLKAHSSEDKLDVKALSKLSESVINDMIAKRIRARIADSLPNFGQPSAESPQLPSFGSLQQLVKENGKFSIESLTNQMYSDLPFIPKEFVLNFIRSLFKGTSSQDSDKIVGSFEVLSDLKDKSAKIASQLILKLLERSGKMNPDTFAKVFTNYFKPLKQSIENFVHQMPKSFSIESSLEAHLIAIRSINTIDQDLTNLKEFVQFAHNEASGLTRKDLDSILRNKNFTQFAKLGIVKKIIKAFASIREEGGISGIRKKYRSAIKALAEQDYISKTFYDNLNFIVNFFNSNETINPSSEMFKKAFDIASSIETDLEILEMSGAFRELVKDYKPKDKHLFNLNLNVNSRLRFRVLKDKDPRALRVGIETNCCQRIGGVGESAAKDSFINPLAGVLVLEWNNGGSWELLSQSYFHYVPQDNSFILDNIESNSTNVKQSGVNLAAAYAYLAKSTADKFKTKYFLAGKGYSKVNPQHFGTHRMEDDPREFDPRSTRHSSGYGRSEVYSDWDESDSMDLLQPTTDTLLQIKGLVGNKDEDPIDSDEIKQAFTKGLRRIILANAAIAANIAAFH
jgi:hypothetical protein